LFDIIVDKLKEIISSRLLPVVIVFIALFGILVSRIFTLQIVEGESHTEELTIKDIRTREIKSTRGNIYDRNGILLAYNKLTYSVVIEDSTKLSSNEEKNTMLFELIKILESYDNKIENEFGISIDENGKLVFNVEGNAELRFKKDAYGLQSIDKLTKDQKAATAEEVFNYLRHGINKYNPVFNIDDKYSLEDALKIMTLRYAIYTNYPRYNQVIIASGVSDETVAAIYENSAILPGIGIQQQTYREYNDSIYTAHILGYTGLINATELEALQQKNETADNEISAYTSSDVIGKTGIEQVYETYLAGKKGIETISVNSYGKFLDVIERTNPVAGSDIYLSIDSKLQAAYYHIIERHLAGILLSKINNSTDDGTRGESAKDIKIPIYDVYFALINNNVINIEEFADEDASVLEQTTYEKFVDKEKEVFNTLDNLLAVNNTQAGNQVSEEMQEYLTYIYALLKPDKKNLLITSKIDTSDEKFIAYQNNNLSLSKFLQHAIANNWIDLTKLNIGDEYLSTEEIYEKLLIYIKDALKDDGTFHKKLYRDLVYSYKLSGTEICLLLFDQGVLKYNEQEFNKLKNGTLSSYAFITDKIRKLEITPAQLALDPSSASVVVTDVKTGDVIAMVTYPSYDNNKLANKIDSAYWSKLNTDLTTPIYHRAAKQKTAPGSTFKMVTAVAGLEEGAIGPSETIYDKLKFDKIANGPKCWSSHSHGDVDVTTALEVSCNFFFYEVGWRLGSDNLGKNRDQSTLDTLAEYAKLLGLDKKSGIELEEAEPHASDEGSIRSAIGQGTNNYSPIQLSRYVTTVATSGKSYELSLIEKIVDKDGKVVLDKKPEFDEVKGVSQTTWNLVQEGMYKVANGSKSSSTDLFKNLPVKVAGKTGTAQESTFRGNHALFVSYAPYQKPEITAVVVIPNGYASSNAVELSRDIYKYYFHLDGSDELVDGPAILPDSDTVGVTD
jgi:penicillin-binding protein 2